MFIRYLCPLHPITSINIRKYQTTKGGIIIKGTSLIIDQVSKQLTTLQKLRNEKVKSCKDYPEGKIRLSISGRRIQYYLRTSKKEKNGIYMPKSNPKRIAQYLQKKYDQEALKILDAQTAAMEAFIRKYTSYSDQLQEIFSSLPEKTKEFVKPIDVSDEDYAKRWLSVQFTPKQIDPNKAVFVTDKEETVRSKSELMIANALNKAGIPYRYECPLKLSTGEIIHPDFTLLNVKKRKLYYWEHRGMMDDISYANHAVDRIKKYAKQGIYLGENLLITEETSNNPLSTSEINVIINNFLL